MELIPLKSSLIHSVAYNSDYNSLQINFHQGSIYVYYNVPESVFEQLISAESAGRFYNQQIKGEYESEKIPPENLQ